MDCERNRRLYVWTVRDTRGRAWTVRDAGDRALCVRHKATVHNRLRCTEDSVRNVTY
jgi:hypothetical protein